METNLVGYKFEIMSLPESEIFFKDQRDKLRNEEEKKTISHDQTLARWENMTVFGASYFAYPMWRIKSYEEEAALVEKFINKIELLRQGKICTYHDCMVTKNLKRCARCSIKQYCSTEHQTLDWKNHKIDCIKAKQPVSKPKS